MKQLLLSFFILSFGLKVGAQCTVSIVASNSLTTICQGNTTKLVATGMNAGATYVWHLGSTNIAGAATDTLTVSTAGVYSVTASNGPCTATSNSITVNVNSLPQVSITPIPASATVCSGDTVVLNAAITSPATFQWNLNGVAFVGGTGSSVHTTIAGVYSVRVVNAITGCANTSAAVNVTVSNRPPPPVASSNSPVCIGDTIKFMAVSPIANVTYDWSGTNTPGFNYTAQNVYLLNTTPAMAGYYKVRTWLNGCWSVYDSTLVVMTCLDSLWPGDANYDLIVDNNDILQIALGYGGTGYVRNNAAIIWTPQFCHDWTTSIAGVNAKHADCNGDGIISQSDTAAVTINYSLTHLKHQHQAAAKGAGLPDLYFDLTGIVFSPGTTVSIPIKLGTASAPMNAMMGIAAKIKVDGMVPANNPTLVYPASWLGTSGNTIRYTKAVATNEADWAYVRTDHHMIGGQGTIANLVLQIPANAAGQQCLLYFDDVKLIDSTGHVLSGYNVLDDSAVVHTTGIVNTNAIITNMVLTPNPSAAQCNLVLTMKQDADVQIQVTDLVGKIVWESNAALKNGRQQITLPSRNLQSGMYLVRVLTTGTTAPQVLRWVKE